VIKLSISGERVAPIDSPQDSQTTRETPSASQMKTIQQYLKIDVTDSGLGMDASTLSHLFLPHHKRPSSHPGSGIGLSISHNLVTQLGGTIFAKSNGTNAGSTFTIQIPLECSPSSSRMNSLSLKALTGIQSPSMGRSLTESTEIEFSPLFPRKHDIAKRLQTKDAELKVTQTNTMRILFAEDNPINQLLVKMGEILNVRIDVVSNGLDAVDRIVGPSVSAMSPVLSVSGSRCSSTSNSTSSELTLSSSHEEHPSYDLAIFDLEMPILNGLECTKTIRQRGINIPVLVMSAHPLDIQMKLMAGVTVQGFIEKPVTIEKLHAAIKSCQAPTLKAPITILASEGPLQSVMSGTGKQKTQ